MSSFWKISVQNGSWKNTVSAASIDQPVSGSDFFTDYCKSGILWLIFRK